jgi:hypothetical protein
MSERGPTLPTRLAGDPDRVALILPGNGYSPSRPLLHFARAVFARHGWTVQEVWWPMPAPVPRAEFHRYANEHAAKALAAETAGRIALVGKSLGSLAAATAADHGLPAIWLTPLLVDPDLVADLARATAPTLLVGGLADKSWVPSVARGSGHRFVEFPDADHGLETDDDPVNSAEILKQATAAMDGFVAQVSRSSAARA